MAIVAILGIFILNISNVPTALAADNYNAATDTYQETRNPNRVSTKTKDLEKSDINKVEKTEDESIYGRLVKKVDKNRDKVSEQTNN